ncbi:hypothetical protein V8F20_008287 [Naviculisporaceae sp. PSN 640]
MCVLRVLVDAGHSWKCCDCSSNNPPSSPSCTGVYMYHRCGGPSYGSLACDNRTCGHPICEDCLEIDSNGDLYEVEKPIVNTEQEEDKSMGMDIDESEEAGQEENAGVEEEGNYLETVEEEADEEASDSQAGTGNQFSLAFRPRVPPRN